MRRLGILFYFIPLLFFTGCQPPGPKSLLEGERLVREGKPEEAIPKLEKAVGLLPGSALAWNHLGLAYQYARKPDDALRAYQQALSLDRNLAAIRFNLGNLHFEQDRLNQAMAELTTCTVLQPTNVQAFILLGKAQLRAKLLDNAQRSFTQALRLEPNNVEALNYYGVILLNRRKAKDALPYFAEALKQDPNYGPAILNQAILYHHYIVNKPFALQRYRDFLATRPDPANSAAATEAGRVLEAELAPKVVVKTNPPPALVITNRVAATATNLPATNRATAHIPPATNKIETNRLAIIPPVEKAAPTNPPTIIASAPKTNDPVAKPLVIATNPPPAPPKTNEIKVAAAVTNPPPPVVIKTEEQEPEVIETPKPLEVVKVDDDAILIAPPRDVSNPKPEPPKVAVKPPEPPKTSNVEQAPAPLIRPVQPEEKSSFFKKVNPLNWFKSGENEEKVEATPEKTSEQKVAALQTLPNPSPSESAPQTQPDAPKVEPEIIYSRYPYRYAPLPSAGNRDAALPAFNAGFKAHQEARLGAAMDSYREALRLDPQFFEAQLNLGIAAASAGDLSLALAAFEDSVRLDPKSPEARYQFAIVLRRANYPLDAINELKTLLETAPTEARAYLALANIYAQVLNKPESAIPNYQKTLQLAPQHPQAPQIRSWLAQH